MGRMKELWQERMEAAVQGHEQSFLYGDNVRIRDGFYKGVTGRVYQYLEGGGNLGPSTYLVAIADILESTSEEKAYKAVVCYPEELEVVQ